MQYELKVSRSSRELASNPDLSWISNSYARLGARYPDNWIAVKESKVVASDPDLETLLKRLAASHGTAQGFAVEFITSKPRNLLI